MGLAACSSSNRQEVDPAEACPGTTQQALVNGSARESYLALGQDQIRAIVQVVDAVKAPDAGGPFCSGVFATPEWVLTAGHCLEIGSPQVIATVEGLLAPIALPVIRTVAHPSEDVALLQVTGSALSDASVKTGTAGTSPIPAGGASVGRLAQGVAVEMAGYGSTESGTTGDLRFLVESIAAIDAASITVSGFGASGACLGDSGGPLLIRGADGRVEVAGVLSTGSASCRETDTYIRLDPIRGWIQALTGPFASSDPGCGGIASEGRCLYGSALWCSGAVLLSDVCRGGESCGWDPAQMGYRCVPSGTGACQGIDSIGICEAGAARWCSRGSLTSQACGCAPCRIDAASGKPSCGG